MMIFRLYMLAGMVAHKALWEMMKRRQVGVVSRPPLSLKTRVVKTVKVAILLGLVAQTVVPVEVFPMAGDATILRVVGGCVYTLGLLVAILGRLQLGDNWSDIEQGGVIENQRVKDDGVYGYIRHPIYVGDLLLLAGLELALNSWLILAVAALTPVVLKQAIREEATLRRQLTGYDEYAARTKRFIPFVV